MDDPYNDEYTLTEEHAKKHLKSHRKMGQLVYLNEKEVKKAENDYNQALSR